MKLHIKNLVAGMMLFSFTFNISAQIYKRGIGLKIGGCNGYMGIGMKEFVNQRISLENTMMIIRPLKENRCFSFQSLLQINQQVGNSASLYVNVGPNFIFKQVDFNRKTSHKNACTLSNQISISLNTFVGIEKRIEKTNLFFSFDTGPAFYFSSKPKVKYMLNFSIKYTIKHLGFKPHHNLAKVNYKKWNVI